MVSGGQPFWVIKTAQQIRKTSDVTETDLLVVDETGADVTGAGVTGTEVTGAKVTEAQIDKNTYVDPIFNVN